MPDHDRLCPNKGSGAIPGVPCGYCVLIAEARADSYAEGYQDGERMSPGIKALVKALRAEARIADRPGQYDRLNEIADGLKKEEALIRADERERIAQEVSATAKRCREDEREAIIGEVMLGDDGTGYWETDALVEMLRGRDE